MANYTGDEYFAAREADETAQIALQKAHRWFMSLDVNGYLDKLKEAWSAYHGAYYTDISSGHRITFSGEQGELTNIPINHYRNICRHILTMVTNNRPVMKTRAINNDSKSTIQTKLADGLLDYYMREKRLEHYLHSALEQAIVLGQAYVKLDWNATSGEIYDYIDPTYKTEKIFDHEVGDMVDKIGPDGEPVYELDEYGEPIVEEEGYPIYEGDLEFRTFSVFDVVFDSTKEDPTQHDWVLCRSFKNRFDLAAKYPDLKDEILKMETKDQKERYDFNGAFYDESDDIYVYEFFHKRTESMPEGRYVLFLESDLVLMDTPMPYRELPVYSVAPSYILGTSYGYSDTFDALPIQDALNAEYSSILSNHNAFAVQNVIAPRGADINYSQLNSGLNYIEYNPLPGVPGGGKPEALQITSTPPEVFQYIKMLEQAMETVTGVNSVSRGNPESSLKSGTALALVQSLSLQFAAGLQQSYVKLIEDVGRGIINLLKDFAAVPRIAAIVGETNQVYMQEFKSDDLENVNRVIVEMGNPLSNSTAGRIQMASELLQYGLIESPEQYISILNGERLSAMTDTIDRHNKLITKENEKMLKGGKVYALQTDKHKQHIIEHRDLLNDPDLRSEPALVENVMLHIQEHVNFLRTTDPGLLAVLNEQPIPPMGGTPPNPMGPGIPAGNVPQPPPAPQGPPPPQTMAREPNMPTPPEPFENQPVTANQKMGGSES